MTRLLVMSAVCLGLAAGTGCGNKSGTTDTSGGLTAEQMKQQAGGPAADQMKKGNPKR